MDRVDATCRKCGRTFSTAAQTRTTCPGCKAAVTVKRALGGDYRSPDEYGEVGEDNPTVWIAGLLGVLVLSLVSWWRGRGNPSTPSPPEEPLEG